jgi:hypothetical protein
MTTTHRPPPGTTPQYMPRFPHGAEIRSIKFPERRFRVAGIEWRHDTPRYILKGLGGTVAPSYTFDAAKVDDFYEPAPAGVPLPGYPFKFNVGDVVIRCTGTGPRLTIVRREGARGAGPRYFVRGPHWSRWNSASFLEAHHKLADADPREVVLPLANGDRLRDMLATWPSKGLANEVLKLTADRDNERHEAGVQRKLAREMAASVDQLLAEMEDYKRTVRALEDRLGFQRDAFGKAEVRIGTLTAERDAALTRIGEMAATISRQGARIRHYRGLWGDAKRERNHWRQRALDAEAERNKLQRDNAALGHSLNVARGGPVDLGGGYVAERMTPRGPVVF